MYLVNFMESKPWLAKGHARTAHARIRTREAWMDISTALNSDGGCVKTPDQWCKYWKDKKGAVKRKSSLISAKRLQTGGGQVDIPELTEMETKILCIMGGESFGSGDRQYEVDPFQEEVTNRVTEGTDESPSILQNVTLPDATNSQPLEEYLVHWNQSALAVIGEGSVQASLASPTPNVVVTPQATVYAENTGLGTGEPQTTAQQAEILSPGSTETPTQRIRRETLRSRRRLLQQSPRGSAMWRRLLRRSPPTQRRSEMVTLTERFIAIEERRAEAELMMAQAIRASSEGCQVIARAIDRVCDIFSTF